MNKNNKFKLAGYSAISGIVVAILAAIVSIVWTFHKNWIFLKYLEIVFGIMTAIAEILVLNGFFIIAKDKKLRNLEICTQIFILFALLIPFEWIVQNFTIGRLSLIIGIIWIILVGIMNIIYGVMLIKLRKNILKFSKALGYLDIMQGIFAFSIILIPILYIIYFIIGISGLILLAKAFFNKAHTQRT